MKELPSTIDRIYSLFIQHTYEQYWVQWYVYKDQGSFSPSLQNTLDSSYSSRGNKQMTKNSMIEEETMYSGT